MDSIKIATLEQIEACKVTLDVTPRSQVWAMGNDLAVVRLASEIDPMVMEKESGQRRLLFSWGLENMLRATGNTEYYCNVPIHMTDYHEVLKKLGHEQISSEPEFRFKKVL
jgi:hypothetical protein